MITKQKHQQLVTKLVTLRNTILNLLEKISKIELDAEMSDKIKILEIEKIRKELTKVNEEIDVVKKEINLLNTYIN